MAGREVEPWELEILQAFQAWKGSGKGKFDDVIAGKGDDGHKGGKGDDGHKGGKGGDGGHKGGKGDGEAAVPIASGPAATEVYETIVEEPLPPEVTGPTRRPNEPLQPPPPPPKAPVLPGPVHEETAKAVAKEKKEDKKERRSEERKEDTKQDRNPGGKSSSSGLVSSSSKFPGKAVGPKPPGTTVKKTYEGTRAEPKEEPTRPKPKPVEGQLVKKSFDSLSLVGEKKTNAPRTPNLYFGTYVAVFSKENPSPVRTLDASLGVDSIATRSPSKHVAASAYWLASPIFATKAQCI